MERTEKKQVVMTNPLKQGLKQFSGDPTLLGTGVVMTNPLKQGLKLHEGQNRSEALLVVMTNPLKQGLKHTITAKRVHRK